MQNKRFKPKIDKLFWIILIPTSILLLAFTALSFLSPAALFIIIPVDLFTFYFLISPLFGYVELREISVFIKFGFMLKREIPYRTVRSIKKERKIISESMLSLKNSLDHVNIKYNAFDTVAVSVKDNDELIVESLDALFDFLY